MGFLPVCESSGHTEGPRKVQMEGGSQVAASTGALQPVHVPLEFCSVFLEDVLLFH